MARLYLDLFEKALQGDEEAQSRYDWILLELFDQMVRNQSGGDMLNYWKQDPMPAESFVIERYGSEVLHALAILRGSSDQASLQSKAKKLNEKDEPDATQIGQFRLSGEIHQWMYDRYSLGSLLEDAGFQNIRVCRPDESNIPSFNSYVLDIEHDGSVRKPDSLFMEAQK
jgi:hypothetical protein